MWMRWEWEGGGEGKRRMRDTPHSLMKPERETSLGKWKNIKDNHIVSSQKYLQSSRLAESILLEDKPNYKNTSHFPIPLKKLLDH